MKRRLLVLLVLSVLYGGGCIATAMPRFPPDVAAALVDHPMRRLATQSLYVYYPEGRQDEARRVAERLEGCVAGLRQRAKISNNHTSSRMIVVLPETPFNNAFVIPTAVGYEDVAVLPTLATWDFQTELGIPPDPSYIGCHEITHYVHERQVGGFWLAVNAIFGDIITPQIGLDAWFFEGLATYYESRFQPGVGRMDWPLWHGYFHAGVAGQGVSGGDLSEYKRAFHFSNHYLYGSHFITFLVERYGEEKLWQLIAKQADSWEFFLAVNWRFYDVYGRSLSSLIEDFSVWTNHKYPVHARPADQAVVRGLGADARYARAPGGREAFVVSDRDLSPELWIVEANGQRSRRRRLNELLPGRQLSAADPVYTSGLSFTADGKTLYFASVDAGLVENEVRLLRYDVDADRLQVVQKSLGGPGGSVSPDGRKYWFARAEGDRHDLAELDLASGQVRVVRQSQPRQYVGATRPSPDGTRLAVSLFDGQRFTVWIVDAQSGKKLAEVPGTATLADASWADAHRIVYLADVERTFQVFVHDVDAAGAVPVQVTHAPYLAFAPQAAGDRIRFLDREGWSWQLGESPLPAPVPPPPAPEAPAEGDAPPTEAPPAPTAEAAPVAPPAPPVPPVPITATLRVASDEPYSAFDHFFYPQMRTIAIGGDPQNLSWGLMLGGGDRLAYHRWAIGAIVQPETKLWSGSLQYANSQLAPWFVLVSGQVFHWREQATKASTELDYERRQLDASLSVYRSWGGFELVLGGSATDDAQGETASGPRMFRRRLVGGTLALAYSAVDGSSYAGAQHALAAAASTTFYPHAFGTLDYDVTDVRAELRFRFAPPLSRRHTLELRGRGRALLGVPKGTGFLQVGGASDVLPLFSSRRVNPDPDPEYVVRPELPPAIAFYEPLRGFEDLALALDRVGIVDATYTYPLIIDYGFATSLYLLPAFFVRQLDLEVFGVAAADLGETPDVPPASPDVPMAPDGFADRVHGAAGGALILRTVFWRVPINLQYQVARRLSDDRSIVQEFGLSLAF